MTLLLLFMLYTVEPFLFGYAIAFYGTHWKTKRFFGLVALNTIAVNVAMSLLQHAGIL